MKVDIFPWIERLSKVVLRSKTFEFTPEAKADCYMYTSYTQFSRM